MATEGQETINSKQEVTLVRSRMNELGGREMWRKMGYVVLLACPGDNNMLIFNFALLSIYILLTGSASLISCYINVVFKLQLLPYIELFKVKKLQRKF